MEERPKKKARKEDLAEAKTSSPPALQVQAILKEHPWIETLHGFKPPNEDDKALSILLPFLTKLAAQKGVARKYPAIKLAPKRQRKAERGKPLPMAASYYGGQPQLPRGWDWPQHAFKIDEKQENNRSWIDPSAGADIADGPEKRPMYFLAQINMADLKNSFVYHCQWFPPDLSGPEVAAQCKMLYFFLVDDSAYDHVQWTHESLDCQQQYVFSWVGNLDDLEVKEYPSHTRTPTNLAEDLFPPAERQGLLKFRNVVTAPHMNDKEEEDEEDEEEDEEERRWQRRMAGFNAQLFGYPWICQADPRGEAYWEEEEEEKEEEGEKEGEKKEVDGIAGSMPDDIDVMFQAVQGNGQIFYTIPRQALRTGDWKKAHLCFQDA